MAQEKCINLLKTYNIEYDSIKELKNDSFETKISNNEALIIKNFDEKEKIAMEYKTLLNLKNKMVVPEIYKVNDDYITNCSVIKKIDGKEIVSYEDKDENAYYLGEALGLVHVSEINEQSSEEEIKKIWEQYILSKTLYFGTKIIGLFSKDFNEQIFNYLNENMHFVKEDYELSLVLGSLTNEDYVSKDGRVYFNNFSNAMIGDPCYDLAVIYDYYYDNKEQIEKFMHGYAEYMSIPDNFENKLPFYKFINSLDKMILLYENKDENQEEINNTLDILNAIMAGRYNCEIDFE